jgi:hypothetical protein
MKSMKRTTDMKRTEGIRALLRRTSMALKKTDRTDGNGSNRSFRASAKSRSLRHCFVDCFAGSGDPFLSVQYVRSVFSAFALLHVLRSLHALHVPCFQETFPSSGSARGSGGSLGLAAAVRRAAPKHALIKPSARPLVSAALRPSTATRTAAGAATLALAAVS